MKRRQFVQDLAILGVAARTAPRAALAVDDEPHARRIPRWRGFNLQGRFSMPGRPYDGPAFEESDFAAIADWGFDFARLPLWYWTWGSRDDWSIVREEPLKQIDRAVELGRQYGAAFSRARRALSLTATVIESSPSSEGFEKKRGSRAS